MDSIGSHPAVLYIAFASSAGFGLAIVNPCGGCSYTNVTIEGNVFDGFQTAALANDPISGISRISNTYLNSGSGVLEEPT